MSVLDMPRALQPDLKKAQTSNLIYTLNGHQNFLDSGSRKQPTKTYHLSTFGDYEVHLVIMNYLAFNFVICTLVLVASFSF